MPSTFNARAETVAQKPMQTHSLHRTGVHPLACNLGNFLRTHVPQRRLEFNLELTNLLLGQYVVTDFLMVERGGRNGQRRP